MHSFRDHRRYLPHLLLVLHKRGPSSKMDVVEDVARLAGISEVEQSSLTKRGKPLLHNRIAWARQALVDGGLLVGPSDPDWKRGTRTLTPAGTQLANSQQGAELAAAVERLALEGARERAQRRRDEKAAAEGGVDPTEMSAGAPEPEADDEPEDVVAAGVEELNSVVKQQMLGHIRTMDEYEFEGLVGRVLKARLRAESVEVTRKSRDGGFDGVLFLDGLGLRQVLFEAKRYAEGNTVSRAQIDAFSSVVRRHPAEHGIFVTSNRFSSEARSAARADGILLIDGELFVDYMATHEVGFQVKRDLRLYELDPSWQVAD